MGIDVFLERAQCSHKRAAAPAKAPKTPKSRKHTAKSAKSKKGKSKGFGHILFESAEQAKNFIFRFNGFPVGSSGGALKVRVSKQALAGSLSFRSKKMTAHDRKIRALRKEERGRVQEEKDGFAAMQAAASQYFYEATGKQKTRTTT